MTTIYTRKVGVEIEVENVIPNEGLANLNFWDVQEDPSLRNNGLELVSNGPTTPANFLRAMAELKEITPTHLAEADLSDRCSVHVHVDVTDFTTEQLYTLCLLYTIFERPIYLASGNRWSNKYCVPVQASAYLQEAIARLPHQKEVVSSEYRYGGINLNALIKFNSVEFRHHVATLDTAVLTRWVVGLRHFVEMSKQYNSTTILSLISEDSYTEVAAVLFTPGFFSSINYKHIRAGLKCAEGIHLTHLLHRS